VTIKIKVVNDRQDENGQFVDQFEDEDGRIANRIKVSNLLNSAEVFIQGHPYTVALSDLIYIRPIEK